MFDKFKKSPKAVLETTLRLLRSNDLQATSMAMISSESGVSMGSIYNSFSGKEEIVNELYKSIIQYQTEKVLEDFRHDVAIPERFERVWNKLIQIYIDYPDAFLFIEQYSLSPYIHESCKKMAYENAWCTFMTQLYTEAIQERLFKPGDPWAMGQMHWGTIVFLVKSHLQGNLDLTSDVIHMAISSCWNSVSTSDGFNLLS